MKRILVADDEMSIRLLYSEELREEGYEVFTASNGKEALEVVAKEPLDLIILDIKMPEMSGIEVLRQIKEKYPNLPVLLSSAYSEYKQDFGTWASEEYLVKSSDLEDLKAAVRKHLKRLNCSHCNCWPRRSFMGKIKSILMLLIGAFLAVFIYENWVAAPYIKLFGREMIQLNISIIIISFFALGFILGWLSRFSWTRRSPKKPPDDFKRRKGPRVPKPHSTGGK